ncbi:MAG: hypothetical protein DDT40_00279 [candidate division WS2 bacterium]|nr:hypothetical protein [Candidatus Psychracetigena formicireducens]
MENKYNSLFFIPYPQFIKKDRGRIFLHPEATIVLGEHCRKNKIIRTVIQKEIIKKLGIKIKIISEKELIRSDDRKQIFLDILPLSSKKISQYELKSGDFQALDNSYGQGYIIKTDHDLKHVFLIGSSPIGLMYALVTLKQLLYKYRDDKWAIPEIHIRDYPDFEYRSLDWLLNAEVDRWSYDWGDGRKKFIDRIKRRLDICLSYKINMVQFDGYGWGTNRFPGYAEMMRELNRCAQERGIKLVFGGCGGGYGFTYQNEFWKQGKYWGKVFFNRHTYPGGKPYQCMGRYETLYNNNMDTRVLGTCLSNKRLRELKIVELQKFVRGVEPGALYIHDIDTAGYLATTLSWKMRCKKCRKKWPNDNIEAKDGAAGAYADWFKQVRKEISKIKNPTGYKGKDCLPIFTGPLYTTSEESEKIWKKEIEYFRNVSFLMPSGENILFGIREQIIKSKNEYRSSQLNSVLSSKRHGAMVLCLGGGDLFINDHIFTPLATISKIFKDAKAVSLFNGHVHQEAVQALNANYLWNVNFPGSDELSSDRNEAIEKFKSFRDGKIKSQSVFGKNGILDKACNMLFGKKSGGHMSSLYRLKSIDGYGPTAVIWHPVTRRLWNGEQLFDKKFFNEWQQRLSINKKAIFYVEKALRYLQADLREDIEWLLRCLGVSYRFLNILVKYNFSQVSLSKMVEKKFLKDLNGLKIFLNNNFSFDSADPLGGDIGTWKPAIKLLEKQFKEEGNHGISTESLSIVKQGLRK